LAASILLLALYPLFILFVQRDPLFSIAAIPPIYVLLGIIFQLTTSARLLAMINSQLLRLAIPTGFLIALSLIQIYHWRSETAPLALHPKLKELLTSSQPSEFKQLLAKNPQTWQLHWQMAESMNDPQLAKPSYLTAATLAPDMPLPQLGFIKNQLQTQAYAEAQTTAQAAAKTFAHRDRWQAMFTAYQGIAEAKLGLWRDGIRHMQRGLPWMATEPLLLRELARAYQKLGDRKNALRVAIRLRRLEMQ
jgi:hypothetical protein